MKIGKKIGGNLYVHKSSAHILPQEELQQAIKLLPKEFNFDIIKYDKKSNRFSFISSPDWDTSDEPIISDSYLVDLQKQTIKLRKQQKDPEVYHHKWMFVSSDYKGFDINKSKQRSEWWQSKEGINKRKIGKKSYWENVLKQISETYDLDKKIEKYLN